MAFTSGGHAARSDFQPFIETHPSLDYCLHLANFIREVEFWKMTPLTEFVLSCDGKCYSIASDEEFISYIKERSQPDGGKIKLELPDGRYKIRWYDPINGDFLSDEENTSGGQVVLNLPQTTADVVLYASEMRGE